MHGRARARAPEQWIVVEGTHEGIIDRAQWDRVQELLRKRTRVPELESSVGLFAGFLRCGDCGRAMCKTSGRGGITYCCGSYKRYGAGICSPHTIAQQTLERAVLEEVNQLLAGCGELNQLAEEVIREQTRQRDVTRGTEKPASPHCRAGTEKKTVLRGLLRWHSQPGGLSHLSEGV